MLKKITLFIKTKQDIIILSTLFLVVFLIPLFTVTIPLQGDDLWAINEINIRNTPLIETNEFKRSPLGGVAFFYLYKISQFNGTLLSTNTAFLIVYLFQYFAAILLYLVIKKLCKIKQIISAINIPLWTAILFLLQQPAIECYANIANGLRLFGGCFILLFYKWQLDQLKQLSNKRIFYAMIASILAISFYEINLVFILGAATLPLMTHETNEIKSFIRKWKSYYIGFIISLIPTILISGLTFQSTLQQKINSIEQAPEWLNYFKRLIYYVGQNVLPNLHGAVFIGSVGYLILSIVVLLFFVKYKHQFKRNTNQLIMLLVISIIGFLILLSGLPHFAPRLLHSYSILVSLLVVLIINEVSIITEKTAPKKWLLIGICITCSLNLYHFFLLQNNAYQAHKKAISIILKESKKECYDITISSNTPSPVSLGNAYPSKYYKDLYYLYSHSLKKPTMCHKVSLKNNYLIMDVTSNMKGLIQTKLLQAFTNQAKYNVSAKKI